MPLLQSTLVTEVRKISDQQFIGFEGFPSSQQEVAERWSNAIDSYAGANIIPIVIPSNVDSAKQAFYSILLTLTNDPPNGLIVFQQAFAAYTAELALGMQPAFTGTPPPTLLDIQSVQELGLSGASAESCAQALAQIIDTWFRTGIAVNNDTSATVSWG